MGCFEGGAGEADGGLPRTAGLPTGRFYNLQPISVVGMPAPLRLDLYKVRSSCRRGAVFVTRRSGGRLRTAICSSLCSHQSVGPTLLFFEMAESRGLVAER